jgi:serine/threonine protein kinase
VLGLSYLH